MSVNFWVSFVSAIVLFGLALAALNLHKSELVRNFRARRLRRRIVPMVQGMLPLIADYAKPTTGALEQSPDDYRLMRYRADLEAVYQQSQPLFDQERVSIAEFLSSLSTLAVQFNQNKLAPSNVENSVLIGQRIVQELTEIGL